MVIDQTLAFVGGIDLCYGRWDTHEHQLNDDYPPPPVSKKAKVTWEQTVSTICLQMPQKRYIMEQ